MKSLAVLISMIFFISGLPREQRQLSRIYIKGIPFTAKKHIPHTNQSLLNTTRGMAARDGMDDKIFEDSLAIFLEPYLNNTKPSKTDWIDVRTVCLIYWEIDEQERIDTLSFGWVGMAYNDNYYDIDIPLLRFLTSKLPSDYIYYTEQFIDMFPKGRYEE